MPDPPQEFEPRAGDDTGAGPDRKPTTTGAPRWVKAFGIAALVLVVLFVFLQLAGIGGDHGPGRHAAFGEDSGDVLASGITGDRATPEGGRR